MPRNSRLISFHIRGRDINRHYLVRESGRVVARQNNDGNYEDVNEDFNDFLKTTKISKEYAGVITQATGVRFNYYCTCGAIYRRNRDGHECDLCGMPLVKVGHRMQVGGLNRKTISFMDTDLVNRALRLDREHKINVKAMPIGYSAWVLSAGFPSIHFKPNGEHHLRARANIIMYSDISFLDDDYCGELFKNLNKEFLDFAEKYGHHWFGQWDHAITPFDDVVSNLRMRYILNAFRNSTMSDEIASTIFTNPSDDMAREAIEPLYVSVLSKLSLMPEISRTGDVTFPDISSAELRATASVVLRNMGWSDSDMQMVRTE